MSERLKIRKNEKLVIELWLQFKISQMRHKSSLNINFPSNVWQFKEETRLRMYKYVKQTSVETQRRGTISTGHL